MDIEGEITTVQFLGELNRTRHVTILIVTHALPIVLNLATSMILVGDRGILHGPVGDVLQEERLSELYGIPVHVGSLAGQRTFVAGPGGRRDV
jgi:ABC-type cobalamin/Fe3+-siderophores transport system ATPase subunit